MGPLPFDLQGLRLALLGDARFLDRPLLRDPRPFGRFARGDLRFLKQALLFDLAGLGLLLVGDARLAHGADLQDARLLDLLARGDLLAVDRLLPRDLAAAHLALGGDARLGNDLLVGDPRLLDRLTRGDLRRLCLGVTAGAFPRELGALLGAAEFDLALLIEPRALALALDVERLLLGLEVTGADLNHRVLLDVVAFLALVLDAADQRGQAFGVEAVRRVEEFEAGLVDVEDGDAFQLQPVLVEVELRAVPHAGHVIGTAFMHAGHVHLGGDGAQRALELAREQRVQPLRLQRATPERGGRHRDRLPVGLHADIELGLQVHTHTVLGDHRLGLRAADLQRQHVHVHRRDVMHDRPDEGAAVDHHFLAEEAGAHEGDLLGGTPVEPLHDPVDDRDEDDARDQPEDQLADELPVHGDAPPAAQRPVMRLKARVCSVSAISVGRRSIEEAP